MSTRRTQRMLLVAIGFSAAGIWMMVDAQLVVGILAVGFFGVLGIPAISAQIVRPPTLTIDDDGFQISTSFGRGSFSRAWVECGTFHAWGPVASRSAAVSYSTTRKDKHAVRSVNRMIATGDDEAITPGYGGLSAKELAELMNAYREAALRGAGGITGR